MAGSQAKHGRWPTWLAPLTAIVLPVATVRRTEEMRLWQAAAVHALGVVMALVALTAVLAWATSEALLNPASWGAGLAKLAADVNEGLGDTRLAVSLVSMVLAMEGGAVVAGWWLMAWGARDELVPPAFAASLRRVWCATPHLALMVLWLGLVTVPLSRGWSAAVQDYTVPMTQRPWHVRHAYDLIGVAWGAVGVWGLVVLLRVGVARGWSARCRWPAVCEGCGYTLLGVRHAVTCPECGWAVAASVGEETRPGTFADAGAPNAAAPRGFMKWRNYVAPMVRPTWFGRKLRALHPEGGHRWLLMVNAVVVGLVCVAGVVALTAMTGMRWWIGVRDALVLGAVASVGTVGLTLAMASLVGSMTTRLAMFPLMHVACQGACALSALLIAWTAGNWLLLAVLTLLEDVARAWIGFEWIGAAVVAANVAVLAVYIVLLWRMVMAARFANW